MKQSLYNSFKMTYNKERDYMFKFTHNVLLVLVFLFIATYASGESYKEKYKDITISSVKDLVSVYDGDTFKINIPKYPNIIGNNISIRVYGLDTPEKRTKCITEKEKALKAKDFTETFIKECLKKDTLVLRNIQRGKYFRIVAEVICKSPSKETSLTESLIKNDLGVMYLGGTKVKDWCSDTQIKQ